MPARRPEIDQALDLIGTGQLGPAQELLVRVLQADRTDAHAWRVLANIRYLAQDLPNAAAYSRQAEACGPADDADFWWHLARVAECFDDRAFVERLYRRALAIDPGHAEAIAGLAAALRDQYRYVDLIAVIDRGLSLHPGEPGFRYMRAQALLNLGRAEQTIAEAVELQRDAPGNPSSDVLLAFVSNFARGMSPEEGLAAHKRMGTWIRGRVGPAERPAPRRRQPSGDALRVGFLSADLRRHSVSYFVEPLLRHMDRSRFFLACYMTTDHRDERSELLERLSDRWQRVSALQDTAIAQLIRDDRIDVLIDLNGNTGGWQPDVLAMRPAPLIGTYCGYPNTTGLDCVDFRIVDSITDPPGSEALCVERLTRIDPCFLCYTPGEHTPDPAPGPAERGEPITFGSFNNLTKTNDQTLALWARVLAAVPGSRLFIKTLPFVDARVRADVAERLARAGLPPERATLTPPTQDPRSHLETYAQIDISLDTFPYHGTTTTCESLLMGVPVVSLTGTTHASRVGASLLHAAGCGAWAAVSEDAFVSVAARLASDRAGLAALRRSLRPRLLASVLCDQRAFARRFGDALEAQWALLTG
jgi:protein O-GlcNAc transferase